MFNLKSNNYSIRIDFFSMFIIEQEIAVKHDKYFEKLKYFWFYHCDLN